MELAFKLIWDLELYMYYYYTIYTFFCEENAVLVKKSPQPA